MLTITKIFTFEAAHRIAGYPGACRHIHGHSYVLHVGIAAADSMNGDMIMDFKDLGSLVKTNVLDQLDHSLMLSGAEENNTTYANLTEKLFRMDTEPTAERITLWIVSQLSNKLPDSVKLIQVKLFETATSYACWEA